MSYIKDQLMIMPINTLIKLHNEVADRLKLDTKIYYFDEDGLNECFSSPWGLFTFLDSLKRQGIDANGVFTRNYAADIVAFPICDLRNEEKSPIDFKAIELELKNNESLAYTYNISCEEYDKYPVDKFIAEWGCRLPPSKKEDIINIILEEFQIHGEVKNGIIQVEKIFEREYF